MATTTNYGWVTPDDTSLVKDGAAAIRTLGSSVDTTTKALNPSTTLGDIEYRSSTANTNTRVGIGSTGQVLTVAGGVPTWSAPASFGGPTFSATMSANQSLTSGVYTKLQFDNEEFDTDGCYDPTTNYRFTPNKAGYYLVTGFAIIYRTAGGTLGTYQLRLYKNGSVVKTLKGFSTSDFVDGNSYLLNMNGTTDYLELFGYGDGGGTAQTVEGGATTTSPRFQAHFVRS